MNFQFLSNRRNISEDQIQSGRRFQTTKLARSSRKKLTAIMKSQKFLQKVLNLRRCLTEIKRSTDIKIEVDKKTLTPEPKKLQEIKYFKHDRVEKLIQRQEKVIQKETKKNALRKSNLVSKLLKGKWAKQSTTRELILFSLTKNAAQNLHNITLFSEERKIQVFGEIAAKVHRTDEDILFIMHLLELYPDFVAGLNMQNLKKKDTLKEISKKLSYRFVTANRLLFRYGDIGNNYYIVLKGRFGVVIFKEVLMNLSQIEYSSHLINLKKMGEDHLLLKTLSANNSRYGISYANVCAAVATNQTTESFLEGNEVQSHDIESHSMIRRLSNKLRINSVEIVPEVTDIVSVHDYMNRLEPELIENALEKRIIKILKPELVAVLERGKPFGEALDTASKRRMATIVSLEDSHLGVIDKESYQLCLREINEKIRKANLNILFDNEMFKSIYSKGNLSQKYYTNFVLNHYIKKRKIVSAGDKNDCLFIIKSGEFLVSLESSLKEICRIIKSMGGKITDLISREEYLNNDSFRKVIDEVRTNKIKIVGQKELLGLDDMKYQDKWLFDIEVISIKGQAFSLEKKFLDSLVFNEDQVQKDTKKLIETNRLRCIERLRSLVKSQVEMFFSKLEKPARLQKIIKRVVKEMPKLVVKKKQEIRILAESSLTTSRKKVPQVKLSNLLTTSRFLTLETEHRETFCSNLPTDKSIGQLSNLYLYSPRDESECRKMLETSMGLCKKSNLMALNTIGESRKLMSMRAKRAYLKKE